MSHWRVPADSVHLRCQKCHQLTNGQLLTGLDTGGLEEILQRLGIVVLVLQSMTDVIPQLGVVLVDLNWRTVEETRQWACFAPPRFADGVWQDAIGVVLAYLQGGGEQSIFWLPVPVSLESLHCVRSQKHTNYQPGNLLQVSAKTSN